jgi:hypothetical protein
MVAIRALHRSELLTRGEGLDGLAARDRRLRGSLGSAMNRFYEYAATHYQNHLANRARAGLVL